MKRHLTIREMPTTERPREKALQHGMQNLSDSELLAILIGTGSKGMNALGLANVLLARFENLRKLSDASLHELQTIHGVGVVKISGNQGLPGTSKAFSKRSYQTWRVFKN